MKVAYVVSRFPHVSETFIVRELDAVSGAGVEVELLSLFPAVSDTVHPAAAKWLPRLRRGRISIGVAACGWWLLRRPLRLLSSSLIVCGAYGRRPALALRALTTLVIACRARPRSTGRPRRPCPRPLRDLPGARGLAVPAPRWR